MCIPTTQGEDPLLSSAVWSHCFMSRGSGIILGTGPGCPESCEYPIPGGAQGQAGLSPRQPELVSSNPIHGRGSWNQIILKVSSNLSYSVIPTQPLWVSAISSQNQTSEVFLTRSQAKLKLRRFIHLHSFEILLANDTFPPRQCYEYSKS